MLDKIFISMLVIGLFAGTALADEVVYTLNPDWTYETKVDGTYTLSVNPAGGINVEIDVHSGIEGGLSASRHLLQGFSINTDAYVELEFSSLDCTVNGTEETTVGLCLELEFSDDDGSEYELAMSVGANSEMTAFVTWYSHDNIEPSQIISTNIPIQEGSLGLYFHDDYVSPYYRNSRNQITYPFTNWNISNIVVPQNFAVDNDFEANTTGGGTVTGSVNLKRVVFGQGEPPSAVSTSLGVQMLLLD